MTLKVKRKKKLKKKKGERRGAEDRKVGDRGSKLRGEKERGGEKGEKGNKTYLKRKFLMIGSMNSGQKETKSVGFPCQVFVCLFFICFCFCF